MTDREICLSHYGPFIIRVRFWGCVLSIFMQKAYSGSMTSQIKI